MGKPRPREGKKPDWQLPQRTSRTSERMGIQRSLHLSIITIYYFQENINIIIPQIIKKPKQKQSVSTFQRENLYQICVIKSLHQLKALECAAVVVVLVLVIIICKIERSLSIS